MPSCPDFVGGYRYQGTGVRPKPGPFIGPGGYLITQPSTGIYASSGQYASAAQASSGLFANPNYSTGRYSSGGSGFGHHHP